MPKAAAPRIRAVPAVTRAVAILRLLGRTRTPIGVKAISQALGLVPSTSLHILRVLVAEELVRVDAATKHYSLGVGMLSLARTILEHSDFATLAQPRLDALATRYGVAAIGIELPNLEHMVVVALSRTRAPVRLHVDVGSRFPALISATGRLAAAFGGHSWKEIEKRFRTLRWQRPPDFEAWRREVELARKRGYSIDRRNYIAGVTLIAVPVLDAGGRLTHTLVAAGMAEQLDNARCQALAQVMRADAARIAALLAAPAGEPR
jgi:DNA-binding IclR family transcriptional regulator